MVGGSHQEKRISLFYSYSHRDEALRDKLDTHLAFLCRSERIAEWHDRKIGTGTEWEGQIDQQLAAADIILLLVSADFIASDYCWGEEMAKALERHQLGEARVIPVILRPCQWQRTPLGSLQAVPKDGKPVSEWPNRDAAFNEIAAAVESTVADLEPIESVAPPPRPIDPLPPLPQRFVGRVNERARLSKTLRNEPRLPAVVLGGPGMGKSTLCIKIINQDDIKNVYDRICYVRLDNITTTDAMIAKLRDNLGLIAIRSAFKQVMGELEHSSNLLLLDNFEDYWWSKPKESEEILSQLAQIHQSTFVITLRGTESPLGPRWGSRIDLPPLSYDESRILFTATSERNEHLMDPDALDEIIRSMDGIPLAIVLMGRRAQTDPLPQLAKQWTRKRTEILRHGKSPDRVTSLDVSVNVSLGDPRMDKEAMRLLKILGILPTGLEFDDLEAILPETGGSPSFAVRSTAAECLNKP